MGLRALLFCAEFHAADEEGVYLQVENSNWTHMGSGAYIDQWIYNETDAVLKEYGNHPSFVFYTQGNEPGGPGYEKFLAQWLIYAKNADRRMIFSAGAGWPSIRENYFHNIAQPRIQAWGEGTDSLINAKPPSTDFNFADMVGRHTATEAPVVRMK